MGAVIVIALLVVLAILLIEFLGRTARSDEPVSSE
jgi:hypothetical protein